MSSSQKTFKKFVLNNGLEMPAVGMGTYRIRNESVLMQAVDDALRTGYRMFDTAAVYGNEQYLKKAFNQLLPKYGLEREDIFITTKMAPSDHGGNEITEKAFLKSLDNLGLEYIDLYLIHFPGTARIPTTDPRNKELRGNTWAKLVEIYDSGKVKAIGVSNYTVRHLKELAANSHGLMPAVNQVEWHPYYFQPELLKYCNDNDILLQAYCSLGGTSAQNASLLEDPVVVNIAKKLNVTRPQLLLAWAIQQGVAVIPKSTNPEHIKQNIELEFVIPKSDLEALNGLGRNNIKYAWDPSEVV
ncbi:unnamed protein product [Plutella xylostella]|uniref:(diamondback moth) hypothetical protein n=1 Tax=Plutella xylostella TaxID=51655 RepID=A0A8S4FPY6_PLUXY|nr:unnamed protein product [Plutella xylostella]